MTYTNHLENSYDDMNGGDDYTPISLPSREVSTRQSRRKTGRGKTGRGKTRTRRHAPLPPDRWTLEKVCGALNFA